VLGVAVSAGEAIKTQKYREFDALVGNFGCQITALDVQEKLKDLQLREEAIRVSELAQEILNNLGCQMKGISANPGESFASYASRLDANIPVSSQLMGLFRFKLLNNIHSFEMKNGIEVPVTDVSRLRKGPMGKKQLETLIRDLQVEESAKAALFMRRKAKDISANEPRNALINRLLQSEFEKRGFGITCLPSAYTMETVFRTYDGLVLVQNKTTYNGITIPDCKPQQVYMDYASGEQLSPAEIASKPLDTPILVVEGEVKQGVILADTIKTYGLLAMVLDSAATVAQYARTPPGDSGLIADDDALRDVKWLCRQNLSSTQFNLDHIYCASLKEVSG